MRRRIALGMIVVLMAACSSNDLAEQGNRSQAGKDRGSKAADNSGGKRGNGKGPGSASGAGNDLEDAQDELDAQGGVAPGSGAEAPEDFGGADAPNSGINPSLASAGATVTDGTADAKTQGLPPRHTEITEASVQGLGKNVVFTVTFAAPLPSQLQEGQYMVVAFGISGHKDDEGFSVGAIGNDEGWEPYGGKRGDNQKLPGRFEISENQMSFEVPWSFVKGPRAFEWYGSSGWYGQLAKQTHWSFDGVPNDEAAKFPG